MKIGILTFHCAHNYGAMLQTYATQELLSSAGHDVEVIDYRPSYLTVPYRWFSLSRIRKSDGSFSVRHLLAEMVLLPFRYVRYHRFQHFMTSRLNLSAEVVPDTFTGNYDAIVFGSDQVWNLRQTGGRFDSMYIADFRFPKGNRKYIADAVSMEPDRVDSALRQQLSDAICRFDAVSAREKGIVSWLNTFSPKEFVHIQDPVLHIDSIRWKELAPQVVNKRPYLLVYRMMNHKNIDPFVDELASRLGLDVCEILSEPDARNILKARQTESVENFVGYFANASFVVTTSFHGTAFSLIFGKQFCSFSFGDSRDLRVRSLLESLGISDRMIPVDNPVIPIEDINYEEVSARLACLRKESSEFILKAVSDVDCTSDPCKIEE